jgi:hypothetical protein
MTYEYAEHILQQMMQADRIHLVTRGGRPVVTDRPRPGDQIVETVERRDGDRRADGQVHPSRDSAVANSRP